MERHGTKIEWTHIPGTKGETWNPIRARNRATGGVGHFCEHVSEGCRNCYAERLQPRFKNPIRYARQDRDEVEIFLDETVLTQPLRWKAPRTIFVCSMSDLFGDFVSDDMIDQVFAVAALCPQHTFIVLTKRASRMREYLSSQDLARCDGRGNAVLKYHSGPDPVIMEGFGWPLPNVWIGVSVEDQKTADERIPDLLATPATLRFLSCEPLLGPVGLTRLQPPGTTWLDSLNGREHIGPAVVAGRPRVDWVIAGGESGPDARPMHPGWLRSLRDQCAAAGVPFFFKQWGEFYPERIASISKDGEVWRVGPDGKLKWYFDEFRMSNPPQERLAHVGKAAAGAVLDAVEHRAFPKESAQ